MDVDGREVVFLRRRFLPQPETLAEIAQYTVGALDRLDNIAAAAVGDAELFWQVGDANRAMDPDELAAETGRRLRITLPAGIPGASHA
jgi:hypothetical protein